MWIILHPNYLPDLDLSDYLFFRNMHKQIKEKKTKEKCNNYISVNTIRNYKCISYVSLQSPKNTHDTFSIKMLYSNITKSNA